jgi:hypothetical protein
MSTGYWKMVGENVARGVGEKAARRLGTGAKFLGRAGAAAGIGFLAYELFKNYKNNIEKEPAYREMAVLRAEMAKWTSTISCLGREAYAPKDFTTLDEGGAIGALFPRKGMAGKSIKPPDVHLAASLVKRAARYLEGTENLLEAPDFEVRKQALIAELEELSARVQSAADLRPIQKRLSAIVAELKPVETGHASRIYGCSREIQKTLGHNAAWAALSVVTFGTIKKPAATR